MHASIFCTWTWYECFVWTLACTDIIFRLALCCNDGGNLAGQQLVCNRDPFRVQTSFPAAPWELHQEREKKKTGEGGGDWTQEVITVCIEIGLTPASTPSPPCPNPDWTQQMLVEVESRDRGGLLDDSCTLSVHASHCLEWKGKKKEARGKKREGIVDYWFLKLHFVQRLGRNANNVIELMAKWRERVERKIREWEERPEEQPGIVWSYWLRCGHKSP